MLLIGGIVTAAALRNRGAKSSGSAASATKTTATTAKKLTQVTNQKITLGVGGKSCTGTDTGDMNAFSAADGSGVFGGERTDDDGTLIRIE